MTKSITKISPALLEMLGTRLPNSLQPFSREIFLLDIIVAGTSYCKKIDDIYPKLEKGVVLRMQRHPKNIHDKNAIALYLGNDQVGWVPRDLNLVISRLMDAGKAFFCRIEKVDYVDKVWVRIEAKIYMVE